MGYTEHLLFFWKSKIWVYARHGNVYMVSPNKKSWHKVSNEFPGLTTFYLWYHSSQVGKQKAEEKAQFITEKPDRHYLNKSDVSIITEKSC